MDGRAEQTGSVPVAALGRRWGRQGILMDGALQGGGGSAGLPVSPAAGAEGEGGGAAWREA